MYCVHIIGGGRKCFKTRAQATRYCKASANRGRCCEVSRTRRG